MKKLRNLIAVMAMMSMAAVLTGCGDDDDEDDDDSGGGGPQIVAPQDVATLTAQNRTYTINVAGDTNQYALTFPAAGQYRLVSGDATEEGTISGEPVRNENTWTMNIVPNENQEGAQAGALTLVFNTGNEGTFSFQPTGGGQADTGTFTVTTGNGGTTDGTTNGGTPGGTNGGDIGADLTGRTLQFTYPGGSGDKFEHTSATAVSWENGTATGAYSYDPASRQYTATLPSRGETFTATLNENGSTTVSIATASGTQTFDATWALTP